MSISPMAKLNKQPSFQVQSEQHSQEEALRIAKAHQRPGQSKEQTKLIAKGIEKGIAEFKKQEKAKARVRNKVKKNTGKHSSSRTDSEQNDHKADYLDSSHPNSGQWCLVSASVVFVLLALHYIIWFFTGTSLFLESVIMPSKLSLLIAGVCMALSGWLLYSRSQ